MPPSNPRPDAERGSASIEVLVLGVLLLVPLIYLVLTLSALQGASFAVAGAARQAARAVVIADDDADGAASARAAVQSALADWRIPASAATLQVRCSPDPADCRTANGTVSVAVTASVALPLLPPAITAGEPGTVALASTAVQRVSMFEATG